MTERPIIFSGPMVQAILAGKKTQTRRPVNPQPTLETQHWSVDGLGSGRWMAQGPAANGGTRMTWGWKSCPYGQPGGQLWVRETFAKTGKLSRAQGIAYSYRADFGHGAERVTWTPSIHMPRAASRITLEVTGVRVERLNAISREDAAAEGMCFCADLDPRPEWLHGSSWPEQNFEHIWEHLNGRGAWRANPWVWVVTFRRVDG